MTKTNMDLSELLAKHDQGDFLRGIAEAVLQLIMVDFLVGVRGFEPPAPASRRQCSTRLSYTPTVARG
jgi:hypothetical protein